jgi:hypothetical protein
LQTKHGANSSSGDRLFLISVPATVGCRVACAPRAHNRRRPRVEGNKVVPWPTRRGRNMHRHISRRLHPLHASQDARRPQGRVAAEAAASKTTKAAKSVVRLEVSPYLMQPFAFGSTPRSPVTPTGDATPLLSHDANCTSARRDSGRVRVLVQGPVTNTSSLRGKSRCLLGAKSRRTRHSHGGPRWH